jgi:phosphotransferase system, enzyme I, PtsP
MTQPPLSPRIHARGQASRLDAVLELVAFCARPRPLTSSLDELPRRISKVFAADVCSIYLVEGEDLVMRGNVGFPAQALGEVRLPIGQGITGLAVEYMRPMSLDTASSHASYRHFPGLGEERFPLFLAVPIPGPSGPLGALVLQKRDLPAFSPSDVELASALCAPIAAMVERAKLVDTLRGKKKPVGSGLRRVTLSGRNVVAGRAVGALCALPRPSPSSLAASATAVDDAQRALERAMTQAHRSLEVFAKRARLSASQPPPLFNTVRVMLEDGRLRERSLELVQGGRALSQALTEVGSEVVKTATRVGDAFALERATDLAEVCEALAMLALEDRRELPRSAILIGDNFTVFDLLVTARYQPSGVVLSEHARGPQIRPLLELMGVPSVIEVTGLFRWAADGEVALVDGDHGLVRLNPSRAEINAVRAEKKGTARG